MEEVRFILHPQWCGRKPGLMLGRREETDFGSV